MKKILIYRSPTCERCARFARMHHALDWFDAVDDTTAVSPIGPMRPGQIAVKDLQTGAVYEGAEALRLVYRHIVAYWPLLLLLWIPPLRKKLDREVRGIATEAA